MNACTARMLELLRTTPRLRLQVAQLQGVKSPVAAVAALNTAGHRVRVKHDADGMYYVLLRDGEPDLNNDRIYNFAYAHTRTIPNNMATTHMGMRILAAVGLGNWFTIAEAARDARVPEETIRSALKRFKVSRVRYAVSKEIRKVNGRREIRYKVEKLP